MNQYVKPRAALSPEKRVLLELLIKEKRKASVEQQRIRRAGNTDVYPLSFEQERLWFLHLLEPASLMHHLNRITTLDGPLDAGALQESFDEIVRRHEILRTTIRFAGESAVQIVAPPPRGVLTIVDLRSLPEAEQDKRGRQLALEQAREPFDMVHGPLMRAALVRLRNDKHTLLLTLHHVITDWWSFGVFYRELSILHRSFSSGTTSPLPELPIQYGDFARWQREWLQGRELERLLSYWRKQLSGCNQLLNLPLDRPRPLMQTFQGRRLYFALPKDLYQKLEKLGHAEDVTTFVTCLAVFQVLLHRYTGQPDILVGSPSANRSKLETESLIGFLLNTLVLRGDFSGDPTFRELLRQLRETVIGAYGHQDLPFQMLVKEVQHERDLGVMPLVQACFIFLSGPSPKLDTAASQLSEPDFPGLSVQLTNVDFIASEFDLTLSLENRTDYLDGFFEYNTALFEESTVSRMVGHLRTLMESVLANPDQRISELSLLTQEEKHGLLDTRGESTTSVAAHQPFYELFESQAAKTPDAIALIFEDEFVSYLELNGRANQLARHLKQLGVGPDAKVAILLERSVEMVVGLLAILKAGGAYVPLDLDYPRERLRFMLDDCGATVLLTDSQLVQALPECAAIVVCVDTDAKAISQPSIANLESGLSPENLAYVIYTSGSTGRPKGVQITHGALANFLAAMVQQTAVTSEDALLAITTISFDISTLEIFLPLITGARTVLAGRESTRDGARLLALIEHQGITIVQATPGTWQLMLGAEWSTGGALKILSGGEALPGNTAAQLLERSASLWNVYGPTEATVWASIARVTAAHETHLLGESLAGAETFVFDPHLQSVPVGVAGEICIAGACLARGYEHSPALTAERFRPNPFSDRAGTRVYRTGDLGRRRADGIIEFLGRSDYQVKLRGMRIELGEIEAALREHPDVEECVVALRGEGAEAALVAYIVAVVRPESEEIGPEAHELRSYLSARLPRRMVPSAFVTLERLPLMVSGKVDRRALPDPSPESRATSAARFVAPANELERTIAGIWSEVLGLEQVGTQDNFFDLGGHSLRLLQVHLKLRPALGRDVPLFELFQYPTVSTLAAHLHQGVDLELDSSEERGARRKQSAGQRRLRRDAARTEANQQAVAG